MRPSLANRLKRICLKLAMELPPEIKNIALTQKSEKGSKFNESRSITRLLFHENT
jgi:hypothetical protein